MRVRWIMFGETLLRDRRFQNWVDGEHRSRPSFRITEHDLEGLSELRQALELGRVKATARRQYNAIPRSLPSHLWPRLTFEIRRNHDNSHEACVCLNDNFLDGWSDLLFRADQVIKVWPPRGEKGQLKGDADERHAGPRVVERSQRRQASESKIMRQSVRNTTKRKGPALNLRT